LVVAIVIASVCFDNTYHVFFNYDDTKDANKLAINTAIKEALSDTNMSIDFAKFISHLSFNSTRIVKEDVICVIEAYTCNDNGDYQDTTVVGKMIQTLLPLSPLLVNVLQTAEDALSA
jgi:hypothetical protein